MEHSCGGAGWAEVWVGEGPLCQPQGGRPRPPSQPLAEEPEEQRKRTPPSLYLKEKR